MRKKRVYWFELRGEGPKENYLSIRYFFDTQKFDKWLLSTKTDPIIKGERVVCGTANSFLLYDKTPDPHGLSLFAALDETLPFKKIQGTFTFNNALSRSVYYMGSQDSDHQANVPPELRQVAMDLLYGA